MFLFASVVRGHQIHKLRNSFMWETLPCQIETGDLYAVPTDTDSFFLAGFR